MVRCTRVAAVLLLACPIAAAAQGFPTKPVRIVTSPPGGGVDLAARLIGPGLSAGLGQQVVIENRGGILSTQTVLKAAPDGHTLLLDGFTVWLLPLIRDDAGYDPLKDLAPVTLLASSPNIIVVHPSLPVKSVSDLIAFAKGRPGQLNYGSGSVGGAPHLAVELFKSMAGVNLVHVPYKGTARAITELVGGQIQIMITTVVSVAPHVKANKLKALAVTSAQPTPLAPDVPTAAATGLPGYESTSVYGMLAPAGTPPAAIVRLSQEIARAANQPEVKERMAGAGLEPMGSTPDELAKVMRADIAKWGKVIRDAGIRE